MSTLVDQVRQLGDDIKSAIQGLAGGSHYPDLLAAVDWLVNAASPPSSVQPAGYVCENMLDELADGKRDAINLVSREGAELTGALGPADIPLYRHPSPSVQPEKEERRPLTDAMFVQCIERVGFRTWDSRMWALKREIEAAHGISPSPSMVGREDTTHE